MCFYSVTDFSCGDWKWGNMRERCPREKRLGQVCGAKLVHPETSSRVSASCTVCANLAIKRRRLQKAQEQMAWKRSNGSFENSAARLKEEMRDLCGEISSLESKRESAKSIRLAATSATYAAAGVKSNSLRLVSNGRTWEPNYGCQSPTADMMGRLSQRW